MVSAAMNGVPANWMTASVAAAGLDPATLPATRIAMPVRPWRDIWSAGHSVGLIDDEVPVATLVARLADNLATRAPGDWRARLAAIERDWARAAA